MTVKVITAIKRNPALTVAQFREGWSEHGERVRNHPLTRRYIKRYVQNYTSPAAYEAGEPPYDGFVELWFDNEQDHLEFTSNPTYRGLLKSKIAEITDTTHRIQLIVREETVF